MAALWLCSGKADASLLGQDVVASLLSLCMAKWLRKWRRGWLFVRSNTKNAKSLICFLSPTCNFWLIFKHFSTKNSALSAACHIQKYRNRKLKADFSKSHFQRNRLRSYTQMVISQKIGVVWTWFSYQIKTESVLLTIIPECHTCSLFCGSASQL